MAKAAAEKRSDRKKEENRVVRYLRETWYELKRVSWPTRSEAINLTIIVISVTAFLAVVLGLIDWLLTLAFGLFL